MTSFFSKLFNKNSDRWVYIGSNDSTTDYYDPTSVKIFQESSSIQVTCKRVYTRKGKKILFDFYLSQNVSKDGIIDIHYSLNNYILNYKDMTITLLMIMYMSKSGQILTKGGSIMDSDSSPKSRDIKSGTVDESILEKLLKDYNIQRDWVYIATTEEYIHYYNPLSVKIYYSNNIIQVELIRVYTDIGRNLLLNTFKENNLSMDNFKNLSYMVGLTYIEYKEKLFTGTDITFYSNSGEIIYSYTTPQKWEGIPPDSVGQNMLDKLLKDNDIKGSDSPPKSRDIKSGTVDESIIEKLLKDYNLQRNHIKIDSNEYFTIYYEPSSVIIDKINKTIKVIEKRVFTEKGVIDFLKNYDYSEQQKYIDLNYTLGLHLLNYKDWKQCLIHVTLYTKSDNVIVDGEVPPEWNHIPPDSIYDLFFNKLLKDNNIQR